MERQLEEVLLSRIATNSPQFPTRKLHESPQTGCGKIMLCALVFKYVKFLAVNEEVVSKVFWTGTTKFGCAGQYTDCFFATKNDNFGDKILASESGGSCVGVAISGDEFVAKTMPCEMKVFLACQAQKNAQIVESDVSVKSLICDVLEHLQYFLAETHKGGAKF